MVVLNAWCMWHNFDIGGIAFILGGETVLWWAAHDILTWSESHVAPQCMLSSANIPSLLTHTLLGYTKTRVWFTVAHVVMTKGLYCPLMDNMIKAFLSWFGFFFFFYHSELFVFVCPLWFSDHSREGGQRICELISIQCFFWGSSHHLHSTRGTDCKHTFTT